MSHLTPTAADLAREAKLPDWARQVVTSLRSKVTYRIEEVHRLQARIDELTEQLIEKTGADTGPEDSDTWLWRESGGEELPALGLGKGATVTFSPGGGVADLSVNVKDSGIFVESMAPLMIIPIERNRFLIQATGAKIK